jgi:membrane-associated phospholipid phosphatase
VKRLRENVWPYLGYTVLLNALFTLVYGGANWLASQRASTWRLYLDWELTIPFVPGWIVVYASLALLFLSPLLALQRRELKPFARAFAMAMLIAGLVFVVFPAQLGFARPAAVPGYEVAYATLYLLDRPHNMAPSLHVALGALTAWAVSRSKAAWLRFLFNAWLVAIVASALLTHQHHLFDVVTGLLLGLWCYHRYVRWSTGSPLN